MQLANPIAEDRKPVQPALYDVQELAVLMKCSDRHIRHLVEIGTVPGLIRLGRLVRFHRVAVDSWLAGQQVPGV